MELGPDRAQILVRLFVKLSSIFCVIFFVRYWITFLINIKNQISSQKGLVFVSKDFFILHISHNNSY